MDTLDTVLGTLHFKWAKVLRWENRAPWGIACQPSRTVQFQAVRSGMFWVRLRGTPPTRVEPGDFIVVPQGDACDYLDHPLTPTTDLRTLLAAKPPGQRWIQPFPGGGLL